MIKQDFIMRLIEQFVKALAKILLDKRAGNYGETLQNIDKAFNGIIGLDSKLIDISSAENIISLLKLPGDNTALNIKYIIAAKLIKEKADIKSLDNSEDFNLQFEYQKALSLFLEGYLNNKDEDFPLEAYYKDVEELTDKLEDNISAEVRAKLIKFYGVIGNKKKANVEKLKLKELS